MEISSTLTKEEILDLMKQREFALNQETDQIKREEIGKEIEALLKIYYQKDGIKI